MMTERCCIFVIRNSIVVRQNISIKEEMLFKIIMKHLFQLIIIEADLKRMSVIQFLHCNIFLSTNSKNLIHFIGNLISVGDNKLNIKNVF